LVQPGANLRAVETTELYDRLSLLLHDAERRGTPITWPEPCEISWQMAFLTCFCVPGMFCADGILS